ncbi:hypothetical protein ACOBQX_07185 [Actinokineospora sp. G85]|uniref:hypothetical protein n=1 Tax=Actinokineospora sp. G85 TaxID=3406626 RepID=UPI003C772899
MTVEPTGATGDLDLPGAPRPELAFALPAIQRDLGLGGFAVAVAALVCVRPLLPAPSPLDLRGAALVTAAPTALVGSAAVSSVFFFLALYLSQVKGYTPLQTSGAFAPFVVVLPDEQAGSAAVALFGLVGPRRPPRSRRAHRQSNA